MIAQDRTHHGIRSVVSQLDNEQQIPYSDPVHLKIKDKKESWDEDELVAQVERFLLLFVVLVLFCACDEMVSLISHCLTYLSKKQIITSSKQNETYLI